MGSSIQSRPLSAISTSHCEMLVIISHTPNSSKSSAIFPSCSSNTVYLTLAGSGSSFKCLSMMDTVHQSLPDNDFMILPQTLDLASWLRKWQIFLTPYSFRGIARGGLDSRKEDAWL